MTRAIDNSGHSGDDSGHDSSDDSGHKNHYQEKRSELFAKRKKVGTICQMIISSEHLESYKYYKAVSKI